MARLPHHCLALALLCICKLSLVCWLMLLAAHVCDCTACSICIYIKIHLQTELSSICIYRQIHLLASLKVHLDKVMTPA
jgi:hypothetical protein